MDSSPGVQVKQLDSSEVPVALPEHVGNDPLIIKEECQESNESVMTVNGALQETIIKQELDLGFALCNLKGENAIASEHNIFDPSECRNDLKEESSEKLTEDMLLTYYCNECRTTIKFRKTKKGGTLTQLLSVHTCQQKYLVYIRCQYFCITCQKVFNKRSNLTRHMELHKRIFECRICKENFSDRITQSIHEKMHTDLYNYYACEFCKKLFMKKCSYNYHFRSRHPTVCSICYKSFVDANELQKHVNTDHNKRFRCKICQISSRQRGSIMAHISVAHNLTFSSELIEEVDVKDVNKGSEGVNSETAQQCKFRCKVCSMSYDKRNSFNRHIRIHGDYYKISCKSCKKKFYDEDELKEHSVVHTNKFFLLHTCEVCGNKFSTERNLQMHMVQHNIGDHPFSCSICSESFSDKESLKRHKYTHYELKRSSKIEQCLCEVCGKIFPHDRFLRRHNNITHSGVKPFSCDVCNKRFSTRNAFQRHMRNHKGERPFHCDECKKTFILKSDLRKHVLVVHTKIRPYVCNVCQKTFPEKGNLKAHIVTHTGARPFECDTCGKSFAQKATLTKHFRVHTGDRPFSCEICHKTYTQHTCLRKHRKVHLGIRSHPCNLCGRSFYEKAQLENHVRIHTGEKPFSCNICGRTFTQKSTLGKHLHLHAQREEIKE